jgi:hypothetical protein
MRRRLPWIALLLAGAAWASHDDELGARYVHGDGADASNCLDHDVPCQSIQHALLQAEPGHTVKVAEGIYDMTGVDPSAFCSVSAKQPAATAKRIIFSRRTRTRTKRS